MRPMYYIGLDVHKQKISHCVKDSGGKIHRRIDCRHPSRSRPLDEKASIAMECGDGGDDVHGLDL